MRLASVLYRDRPAIVAWRAGEGEPVLVRVDAELGPDAPFAALLAEAERATAVLAASQLTWRPVVPNPRRVICLGLNYRAHVEETGRELPTYPVLFTKWASSLAAAGADIPLPPESAAVDFEAELALVIGTGGRRIPAQRALEHIAGATIANDITMRDYQYKTHQWLQGKAWDACTPVGPYLVTLDEVGDLDDLDVRLTLNGEQMQAGNTARLIFDVPAIIAAVSEFTALEPGDLILTGTPAGVGFRREPKVLLADGDELVVEISRLGRLANRIVASDGDLRRAPARA
jgi:acylpyruvate hydrolase